MQSISTLFQAHYIYPLKRWQLILNDFCYYSPNLHDNLLPGAQIIARYHIWVSVFVVLTPTWCKNFQYLKLLKFHCCIEYNTDPRNQIHFSRVYLLHTGMQMILAAILFSCFLLNVMYPFCGLCTPQIWISCFN